MAAIFCAGLLVYYAWVFQGKAAGSSILARLLWLIYFALGCSALIIALTGILEPVFDPNYPAALFMLACILVSISGFLGFRATAVREVIATVRGQGAIEALLLALQTFSIAFFMPFSLSSLSGDVAANRLEVSSKAEVLATYGLINTTAGLGSHLFMASLVMAAIRLCQPQGGGYSLGRAILLMFGSLSYVMYVLAYVGRDGSIYWLMTALLVFLVFREQMPATVRRKIIVLGASLGVLVLLPLMVITTSRFSQTDFGVGGSLFEYFGSQLHHFSDFASITRPVTDGSMNFPMVTQAYCSMFGNFRCETWADIRPYIFGQYLGQGKAPWLFGTYVSDFVADFGYTGTFLFVLIFSFLCHRACVGRDHLARLTLSRLLLILFYFLTPYWGVFYFRFGIINSFLLVNLAFIALVWMIQVVSREVGSPVGLIGGRIR